MNNVLKLDQVEFSYKKKDKILKGINLQLSNGIIGILGPNGAGKTTLMRILVTLLPLTQGNILLNELDYKKHQLEIRRKISYLPQEFEVYPKLTGKEFLEFIANIKIGDRSKRKKEIDKVIDKLELNAFINKKIKTYSGGMKKRLGIAQSLLGNPIMIIIDEPTAGLDPEQRNSLRKMLHLLNKDKIVILTTHIVEDIENTCDNMIQIDEGRIKYYGSIADYINSAQKKIWKCITDEKGLEEIQNKYDIINILRKGNQIEIKLLGDLEYKGFLEEEPSLQDAYLANSEYQNFKRW